MTARVNVVIRDENFRLALQEARYGGWNEERQGLYALAGDDTKANEALGSEMTSIAINL